MGGIAQDSHSRQIHPPGGCGREEGLGGQSWEGLVEKGVGYDDEN